MSGVGGGIGYRKLHRFHRHTVRLHEDGRLGVPLSTAARGAWAILRRPVRERAPVGYHRSFLEGYVPNQTAYLDEATRSLGISGSVFEPLNEPQGIADLFRVMLSKAEVIRDPFEQAFFIMVQLPYLQPFEDVNKRVSRLATNLPLIRKNVCPLSLVDVPLSDYSHAMLSVYELNRVDFLRDVFIWAYARSASRYSAVRRSLGDPDPFRLRHREVVRKLVAEVVCRVMQPQEASFWIDEQASRLVGPEDRDRLAEVVETELLHLHPGSIARFHLRPAEFVAWQAAWD